MGSTTVGSICPKGYKCSGSSGAPEPCIPGTFQDKEGQTNCTQCPIGYYCVNSTTINPIECQAGRVCDRRGLISPSTLCPYGWICTGNVGSINEQIPPITKTDLEEIQIREKYPFILPIMCNKGYYCSIATERKETIMGDLTTPQPCNSGDYNDEEGKSECKPCPAGFECPDKAMTYKIPCKEGFFRPQDSSYLNCVPCPEGTYADYQNQYTNEDMINNLVNPGFTDINNCTMCPSGIVCISQNLTLKSFKSIIYLIDN